VQPRHTKEFWTARARDYTLDDREVTHPDVWQFVARIVHPLMVAPAAPAYDSKINETAAQLALHSQEFADISRVLFLVLRRKETSEPASMSHVALS
jgi:hypothetical protein